MSSTRTNWGQLVGVAVLLVLVTAGAVMLGALGLYATTHELWDAPEGPPVWLLLPAIVALSAAVVFPSLVVGRVARLRRWWLAVPALSSVVCGLATGAAFATLSGQESFAAGTLPGLVGGSLLGIAVADRLGGSVPGAELLGRSGRPRPTRAREDQVIAGVCGGLARRNGSAPKEVRVLAVVVVVVLAVTLPPLAPLPVFLYLFAWLTWPEEPADTGAPPMVTR